MFRDAGIEFARDAADGRLVADVRRAEPARTHAAQVPARVHDDRRSAHARDLNGGGNAGRRAAVNANVGLDDFGGAKGGPWKENQQETARRQSHFGSHKDDRSEPGLPRHIPFQRREISLLTALHKSFRDGFQFLPARADGFGLVSANLIVGGGGGDDGEQIGKFLHDLVGRGHEVDRVRPGRLRVADEEAARPLANPMDNPRVVGAADERLDAVERIGRAAAGAVVRFGPLVDHGERKTQLRGDLFGAALLKNFLEYFMRFHAVNPSKSARPKEARSYKPLTTL